MKELSEQDKTIFSLCISVINAARDEEHLGEPIMLQKYLDELKEFIHPLWYVRKE
jgi:hypothetical protein